VFPLLKNSIRDSSIAQHVFTCVASALIPDFVACLAWKDLGTHKQVSYDAHTAAGLNVIAGKFHSFWLETCQTERFSNIVAQNIVTFDVQLKTIIYTFLLFRTSQPICKSLSQKTLSILHYIQIEASF